MVAAIEERGFAVVRIVDQLVGKDEVARRAAANPSYRGDGQYRRGAPLLERPQIRAVIHPVRRDRVPVAVTRDEDDVVGGDLPENERGRGLAVGCPDDFPVRDGERRKPGEAAATDDREHGTCVRRGSSGESGLRALACCVDSACAARSRGDGARSWNSPSNHDIIMLLRARTELRPRQAVVDQPQLTFIRRPRRSRRVNRRHARSRRNAGAARCRFDAPCTGHFIGRGTSSGWPRDASHPRTHWSNVRSPWCPVEVRFAGCGLAAWAQAWSGRHRATPGTRQCCG